MSHTKEPWLLHRKIEESSGLTQEYFIADSAGDAVIYGTLDDDLLGGKTEDLQRAISCVNACANLPEPEKNIRELVAALSFAVLKLRDNNIPIDECFCDAVRPFTLNPLEEEK